MSLRNDTRRSGRPPSIIDFYNPEVGGKDAHGRTLDQILRWGKHSSIILSTVQHANLLGTRSRQARAMS
jgi:hypothetical protein